MARYTVHTPDGPKRMFIYDRKYREAERKLNEARANADKGLVFDTQVTLGEWLDSWLSDCLKPLVDAGKMAHSTFVRYEGIVNGHLRPALGHRKLKDLTRAEVRRLYAEKARTLSLRSVDYVHVTLQKALSQALRDDLRSRGREAAQQPRERSREGQGAYPRSGADASRHRAGHAQRGPLRARSPHGLEAGRATRTQVDGR